MFHNFYRPPHCVGWGPSMRLILITTLTMVAFAANSVLNRMALSDGAIGPAAFALIRLGSGALVLSALALVRGSGLPLKGTGRGLSVLALALYMIGFSYAYLSLDAGAGALILFGAVQITMFLWAIASGEAVPARRWGGALIAFSGLLWLLWPHGAAPLSPLGAVLMAMAGASWGVYSMVGRNGRDPLAATAANFLLATPLALLPLLAVPGGIALSARGVALAVLSGAVTSGLGYALWYWVLARLVASVAAVAQLTVPIIAMAGGVLFLGETPTMRFAIASLLVLGGVAFSLGRQRTISSSGS